MSQKTGTKQGRKRRGEMKGDKKTKSKKGEKGNKTLSHKSKSYDEKLCCYKC
jgi:hypothetical protein